jgi:tryptophan-rich sensory protein
MTTSTATASTTSATTGQRVSLRTALTTGAVAGVIAAVINAAIATVARSAFDVSDDFQPLTPGPIVMWTILGALIGAAGWRLFVNKGAGSRQLLSRLVPVVVVLSFIPDVLLLATHAMPGTSTAAVLSLMAMHVITATIVVTAYRRTMPTR